MKISRLQILLFLSFLCYFQAIKAQEISKSHFVAAREYMKKDSTLLAMAELDSATRISPNYSEAYAMKGQLLEQQKNYRKAISQYTLAIKHNPRLSKAYLKRAELHFKLNDHRDFALNDVNSAIKLNPADPELYALKAYYYAHSLDPVTLKSDYGNAINAISNAIYIKPTAEYYWERSQYKFKNEQRLSALADINKAIEIDKSNGYYYYYRALIRFMMNDYKSSLPDLTQAIELDNTDYNYFQLRGNVLYNLGRYDKAYDDYTNTINLLFKDISNTSKKLTPDDPLNINLRQTLLLRGMTLVQINKPYDGCTDFQRAQQMGESKATNYMRKYCQ